ncbi:MAG TPA: YdeI/OmpD-associated family protein [Ktedonobacterales bacterium]|nr:YdeI/OmpD-associated family protein [Ktedonobacterales bacterium]
MPPSPSNSQFERVTARDRAEWRAWLAEHHASAPGAWLIYYKRASGQPGVTYDEAVEEALCVGWIDSTANTLDSERYMQMFTPRKRKSPWSKSNKERAERLIAQGLMTPAGLAAIEAARRDGTWTIYEGIENLEVPDDLRAALAANPAAEAGFAAFSASIRKQLLWWIASAKRPETRQRRLEQVVIAAAERRNPLNPAPRPEH